MYYDDPDLKFHRRSYSSSVSKIDHCGPSVCVEGEMTTGGYSKVAIRVFKNDGKFFFITFSEMLQFMIDNQS